jgi:hypothetical protein
LIKSLDDDAILQIVEKHKTRGAVLCAELMRQHAHARASANANAVTAEIKRITVHKARVQNMYKNVCFEQTDLTIVLNGSKLKFRSICAEGAASNNVCSVFDPLLGAIECPVRICGYPEFLEALGQ